MADISKITALDGTTYDLKDASAVQSVSYSGSTLTVTPRSGTASTYTIESGGTKVTISSTTPSGGSTGDIWLVTET